MPDYPHLRSVVHLYQTHFEASKAVNPAVKSGMQMADVDEIDEVVDQRPPWGLEESLRMTM